MHGGSQTDTEVVEETPSGAMNLRVVSYLMMGHERVQCSKGNKQNITSLLAQEGGGLKMDRNRMSRLRSI